MLNALSEAIPGVIALGRLDPEEPVHRVIETRGEGVSGLSRGTGLPTAGDGDDELDAELMRSLGAGAWLSTPLEASDGRILGMLCAAAAGDAVYGTTHAAQLGVGARLLSLAWENVELRSDVRRLRRRVEAGPGTDPGTGLPGRETFLELLDREWRLAERGTVQSVLVVYRVGGGENGNGAGGARSRLALKVAAEILEANARTTDRIGRIGEREVAAILVGCRLQDAPAFVARFLEALGRVGEGRQPQIEVSCGVQPLGGAASPEEALGLAEVAAGEPAREAAQTAVLKEARE